MSTRLRRLRTGCAVLAATAFAGLAPLALAGPARAAGSNGSFTSPSADAPLTTAAPAIAGTVNVNGCVTGIDLSVTPTDGQAAPGTNPQVHIGGNSQGSQAFTWPSPAPVLPVNGRYVVTATAHYRPLGVLGCIGQDSAVSIQQPFSLAVAPAKPAHVTATPEADGDPVTVRWDPGTEPDLVGHLITRAPASGPCPAGPPAGSTAMGTDQGSYTDTPPAAADAYCYWVQAVRRGASADRTVISAASVPAVASLPAAAAAAADPPVAAVAPTTTTAAPAPATLADAAAQQQDSKEFASLVHQSQQRPGGKTTRTTTPADPDTGFRRTLPFEVPSTAVADDSEPGPEGVTVGVPAGDPSSSSPELRPLAAVAGGLVVLVVAGLLLLVRREVKRAELADRAAAPDAG